ncbi:MAG: DUF2306 domain-containing protein [Pseudomonadota bacterium]|nr:DUF2306 domain-containing protein [Pseudomonadota bacterium]
MAGASVGLRRDYAKWAFFALMALCTLLVIWVDERFLVVPADPEWKHIAGFKLWLAVHGPFGAVALLAGPFQFSDTLRRTRPRVHRWIGYTYIGAIAVAASVALYIGPRFEQRSIQIEQYFQAGGWLLTTLMALFFILRRNIPAHKLWMMRSYGFCLVFLLSRVPDAWPGFHWNDQALSDTLWGLVVAALVVPDLILIVRDQWRKRAR